MKRAYYSPTTEIVKTNPDGIILSQSQSLYLFMGEKSDYKDGGVMNWGGWDS
jgi:hypothetical protein